jgi:hypothetical protein
LAHTTHIYIGGSPSGNGGAVEGAVNIYIGCSFASPPIEGTVPVPPAPVPSPCPPSDEYVRRWALADEGAGSQGETDIAPEHRPVVPFDAVFGRNPAGWGAFTDRPVRRFFPVAYCKMVALMARCP